MLMANDMITVDPKSGFCESSSIFYSNRKQLLLPCNENLDITTFISSKVHRGKTAYIDSSTGKALTFSQLWKAVDSVSSFLSIDLKIRKGDVIIILSPNSIYFPIISIITTTNPLNTAQEIDNQINDSNSILTFTTQSLLPKLAATDLPVILIGGDSTPVTRSLLATTKHLIIISLEEKMEKEPSRYHFKERVSLDDTATLFNSSGTTGVSKGVISSHGNLIAMVQTVSNRLKDSDGSQTYVCTVLMFHIYGLCAFASGLLTSGSTVVVLSKFEIDEMYSLKTVLCGGAPLSEEVTEGFAEKYPNVSVLQGYGLTETTGIGASTDSLEESRRYGTAGLLSPSMKAKIVDPETGTALQVNQTGELWVRGYLSNMEATISTLNSEGWLRTSDSCYIDNAGYIFVVDRLKEMIKYNGYQVPPAELEAVLLTHSDISDAAVIPFPDKEVGQFPMANVVRKAGSKLTGTEIMEFVAKQVASYKRIRSVSVVSAIPKNPSGKILRKDFIKLATSKL
ncbi:hypothetical protein MKX01_022453 [Papaver californicum]|nr:hypothetical protein MKX01_022453 [Papaver californicum]